VDEVRLGVGEGGFTNAAPPPDLSELVLLPTYIEVFG
jgi:hypothetical protein